MDEEEEEEEEVLAVSSTSSPPALLLSSSSSSIPLPTRTSERMEKGKAAVEPEELEEVGKEAEAKLHFAIDEALRRYHHEVAGKHAALVGRRMGGWVEEE